MVMSFQKLSVMVVGSAAAFVTKKVLERVFKTA